MKIVDFKTFNRMPAGTIFAPYKPCVLEDKLAIKVDHGRKFDPDIYRFDWSFDGVMPLEPWNLDCVFNEESVRASFEIYDGDTNDYSDYEQFLVFDEYDIDRLIQVLQWAKGGCKDEDYKGFDEF